MSLHKILSLLYAFLHKHYAILVMVVGVAAVVFILIIRIKLSLSYHPDYSGSERSSVMPIQYVVNAKSPYSDPENAPYYVTQYTPLYFYAVGIPYRLLNFDPLNVHKIYVASRIASLIFVLLGMGIFYFMMSRLLMLQKTISLLFTLILFCLASYWNIYFSRVDGLLFLGTFIFLALTLKGLLAPPPRKLYYLLGAIALSGTLLFVKQSAIIHAFILFTYLLYNREYSILKWLVVCYIAVIGLFLAIISVDSPMYILMKNISGGVQNGISIPWFYFWTVDKLLYPLAFLIFLALAISLKWLVKSRKEHFRFLAIAVVGFFSFATLTSLKQGAAVGYFIEFIITAFLIIAIYFFEARKVGDTKIRATGNFNKMVLSGIGLCIFIHFASYQYMVYSLMPLEKYEQQYSSERALSQLLKPKLDKSEFVYIQGGTDFKGTFAEQFFLDRALAPMRDVVEIGYQNKTFDFSSYTSLLDQKKLKFVLIPQGDSIKPFLGNRKFMHGFTLYETYKGFDIYEVDI